MDHGKTLFDATKTFWDANPCDGQTNMVQRMRFRYTKEPWLPPLLDRVAVESSVLEVGCGQGTDALYCCQRMRKDAMYAAVDCSDVSIASARQGALKYRDSLNILPRLDVGNAESLDWPDGSFKCVLSVGALHHTPNTETAVNEVYRVLEPGGRAYVILYRSVSPKVLAALAIRVFARSMDRVTKRDRCLYHLCQRFNPDRHFGTMLLECLGVPILRCYTRRQVQELFRRFASVQMQPVGVGVPLGLGRWLDDGKANRLGTFWLVEATKDGSSSKCKTEHGMKHG